MRAVFGVDACHLFPECVLAIIPLMEGVQVHGPCALPGGGGQLLASGCGTLSSSNLHLLRGRCPSLDSKMAAAAHAWPWSSCRWCCATWEHVEKEAPMAGLPLSSRTPQQWSLASLVGPGFFPYSLGCSTPQRNPLRLSSRSKPQPSSQGLPPKPEPQHPACACPPRQATQAGDCQAALPSVQVSLRFALSTPVAVLSSKTLKLPLCPHQWGDFPACGNISSFTAPSQKCRSHHDSFLSLSFSVILFSFALPSYLEIFLNFWESEVFCQHPVDVLWESFHM